jgi:hypothetical protein
LRARERKPENESQRKKEKTLTSGPEYVQNIFSRSLKKNLSPEKTETN